MSKSLPPVTISTTAGGQLVLPGDVGSIVALDLYNASPVDLQVNGLPQGSIWLPMNQGYIFDMSRGISSNISFSPGQNPGIVAQTSSVLATVYTASDNTVPPFGGYYVGRNSNVGGQISVADITAQFLEGDAQTLSLTEQDDASGFPVLGPANGANIGMGLGARDAANVLRDILEVHADGSIEVTVVKHDGSGSLGDFEANNIYAVGAIKLVNNIFTAGSFGVPIMVASPGVVNVTSTAQQTILSYTPAADGLFELIWGMRVANGTNNNIVNVIVTYNDRFSNNPQTRSLTVAGNTAIFNTNNGITFGNGNYDGLAQSIPAKAGTAIILKYRDPTNTPNDFINAVLKQVGA